MKRIRTRPYLTPHSGDITISQWMHAVGSDMKPLENRLPAWDAGTNLEVCVQTILDPKSIHEHCRLARDAQLRLVILWNSDGSNLSGSGTAVDFDCRSMLSSVQL